MDKSYRRRQYVPCRSARTLTSSAPMSNRFERIALVASQTPEAEAARKTLTARYGDIKPADADVIVALGGDGLMLQTLHKFMSSGKPKIGRASSRASVEASDE